MSLPGPRKVLAVFKSAAKGWKEDNCVSMGAALAFYSLLSLAPLLMLVITLAGLFIGRDQAQDLLLTQASGLLGETGGEGVRTVLGAADTQADGVLATIVSFAVLAVGATTVFAELSDNLNRIWKCSPAKTNGLWGLLRKRLLSFGLVVTLGFLLLVSLAVSAAVSYVGSTWFRGSEAALRALETAGSLVVTTALFALVFKILPARRIPWGDVLLGSLVTALLFWVGKSLIGLYIGKSAIASDFGAAGTLAVVIVWVYWSSQIFFFGAELTRAYSMEHGSKALTAANADDVAGAEPPLLARARRIVRGRDPILQQKRT